MKPKCMFRSAASPCNHQRGLNLTWKDKREDRRPLLVLCFGPKLAATLPINCSFYSMQRRCLSQQTLLVTRVVPWPWPLSGHPPGG